MKSALGVSVTQMALPWALHPLETSTSDRLAMTQWAILRDACCSSQYPLCLGSFCCPILLLQCHTEDIL